MDLGNHFGTITIADLHSFIHDEHECPLLSSFPDTDTDGWRGASSPVPCMREPASLRSKRQRSPQQWLDNSTLQSDDLCNASGQPVIDGQYWGMCDARTPIPNTAFGFLHAKGNESPTSSVTECSSPQPECGSDGENTTCPPDYSAFDDMCAEPSSMRLYYGKGETVSTKNAPRRRYIDENVATKNEVVVSMRVTS